MSRPSLESGTSMSVDPITHGATTEVRTVETAQTIYEEARLGTRISYSDGTPRPPGRHRSRLRAWEERTGDGYLTERSPGYRDGDPGRFTLRNHIHGRADAPGPSVEREFRTDSSLAFKRIGGPDVGEILCIRRCRGRPGLPAELARVARTRLEASAWAERCDDDAELAIVLPGDFDHGRE